MFRQDLPMPQYLRFIIFFIVLLAALGGCNAYVYQRAVEAFRLEKLGKLALKDPGSQPLVKHGFPDIRFLSGDLPRRKWPLNTSPMRLKFQATRQLSFAKPPVPQILMSSSVLRKETTEPKGQSIARCFSSAMKVRFWGGTANSNRRTGNEPFGARATAAAWLYMNVPMEGSAG